MKSKSILVTLFSLVSVFVSSNLLAQHTCEPFFNSKELEYTVQSDEITTINNQISLNFSLEKIND